MFRGPHQSVGTVNLQDDHVHGGRVVGHADPVGPGSVLEVVELDDDRERPREDPEAGQGRVLVEKLPQPLEGQQPDQRGRDQEIDDLDLT